MEEKLLKKDLARPWGGFIVFADNEQCTVKILFVKKGQILSLQSHNQRTEFWYCISGKGNVLRGPIKGSLSEIKKGLETTPFIPGHNIVIPVKTVHTVEGVEDCQILEVSYGRFDENDIVRYEDRYGRI